MKIKLLSVPLAAFFSLLVFAGCGQEDVLATLKNNVPIFEGANVLDAKVATEKMGVIMMEVATSRASQKEILDFYEKTMTQKGWELESVKDYGKNGSVMELFKQDIGTLSIVTIMKKTEKTGKIPVTLNLTAK